MEELVQRYKDGDKEAFNIIVASKRKELYVIALARLRNYADAEDAVQETFIKACNNINKLRDNSKFYSWLISILINECNKIFNSKKNCCSYEESGCEFYLTDSNSFRFIEDILDFYSIINTKKVEDRTILAMYYTEEYTSKEISQIMHMNENTVKTRIKRLTDKIKESRRGK